MNLTNLGSCVTNGWHHLSSVYRDSPDTNGPPPPIAHQTVTPNPTSVPTPLSPRSAFHNLTPYNGYLKDSNNYIKDTSSANPSSVATGTGALDLASRNTTSTLDSYKYTPSQMSSFYPYSSSCYPGGDAWSTSSPSLQINTESCMYSCPRIESSPWRMDGGYLQSNGNESMATQNNLLSTVQSTTANPISTSSPYANSTSYYVKSKWKVVVVKCLWVTVIIFIYLFISEFQKLCGVEFNLLFS